MLNPLVKSKCKKKKKKRDRNIVYSNQGAQIILQDTNLVCQSIYILHTVQVSQCLYLLVERISIQTKFVSLAFLIFSTNRLSHI